MTKQTMPVPTLQAGRIYTWVELGEAFGFKPNYLNRGGIAPVNGCNASLLVSHPGGAKSFNYEDSRVGNVIEYAGAGQKGDQVMSAKNLDVAENRRRLYFFEAAGPRQLTFIGVVRCVGHREAKGKDLDGVERAVLRFRLEVIETLAADPEATPELTPPVGALEGGHRWGWHRTIERDHDVVAAAKKAWLAADPLLCCEACGFSFASVYGAFGAGYVEAHHRVPLATLKGEAKVSTPADLVPLCANCHRVLHLQPDLTVEALRQRLGR